MSKAMSIYQRLQLISIFILNTNLDEVPSDVAQALIDNLPDTGRLFTHFLKKMSVAVVINDHIVDGNADPFLFDAIQHWKVESHQKSGELKLTCDGEYVLVNGQKIIFYLSEGQQDGKVINGANLRRVLADSPVLNANVLDYLREHPELIPASWKRDEKGNTRYIYFWGTIYYRYSDGRQYVRCLYWNDGKWRGGRGWLNGDWRSNRPAAVLAA